LPAWVVGTVQPIFADALVAESLTATIRVEGEQLFIDASGLVEGVVGERIGVLYHFAALKWCRGMSVRAINPRLNTLCRDCD
jgi:hypothetical protein